MAFSYHLLATRKRLIDGHHCLTVCAFGSCSSPHFDHWRRVWHLDSFPLHLIPPTLNIRSTCASNLSHFSLFLSPHLDWKHWNLYQVSRSTRRQCERDFSQRFECHWLLPNSLLIVYLLFCTFLFCPLQMFTRAISNQFWPYSSTFPGTNRHWGNRRRSVCPWMTSMGTSRPLVFLPHRQHHLSLQLHPRHHWLTLASVRRLQCPRILWCPMVGRLTSVATSPTLAHRRQFVLASSHHHHRPQQEDCHHLPQHFHLPESMCHLTAAFFPALRAVPHRP